MKRRLFFGLLWLLVAVLGRTEEVFSKSIPPHKFSSAGLAKLTPEELAQLDALVREFGRGVAAPTQQVAKEAAMGPTGSEAQTVQKNKKKGVAAWFAKPSEKSTPAENTAQDMVESSIPGVFTGWSGRAVLTLKNGQRWKTIDADTNYCPPVENPRVIITKGALGGYWMLIVEADIRVRVAPVKVLD